jgi:hypothetical protein
VLVQSKHLSPRHRRDHFAPEPIANLLLNPDDFLVAVFLHENGHVAGLARQQDRLGEVPELPEPALHAARPRQALDSEPALPRLGPRRT